MRSNQFWLALGGAAAMVHCGGRLDVGETGAGAPAMGVTPPSAGAGGKGGSIGAGGGAGHVPSAGGSGNADTGFAGESALAGATSGGSGPVGMAGAGNEAGQGASGGTGGGTAGKGGTGGEAGAMTGPCQCGSTEALTAVDCKDDVSYVAYVSADGSVIQFMSDDSVGKYEAGLWTAGGGVVYRGNRVIRGLSADGQTALFEASVGLLRTLAGKETRLPFAASDFLSADGLTVVGRVSDGDTWPTGTWTKASGLVLPDFGGSVTVLALSADAGVLGGTIAAHGRGAPFVWSTAGLHPITGPWASSSTEGSVVMLSDDGTTAVGLNSTGEMTNNPQPNLYQLFRWSEADGTTVLGPVRIADIHGAPDGSLYVNENGSVVAGTVADEPGSSFGKAFRWTHGGMTNLAPDEAAVARGVSADGKVIAGEVIDLDTGEPGTPFVWDTKVGKNNLSALLASTGADLTGWTFGPGTILSRDGTTVVGNGTCNGVPALYRAHLPR